LRSYLILFFSILIPSHLFSQAIEDAKLNIYKEEAVKIVRSSLEENAGYEWLRELCEIGPRLSGSEESYKAIYWAEKKMKEIGYDTVWLQPVMVPVWRRGDVESAVITSSKEFKGRELAVASLGNSVATPHEGITGKVIEVKNFEELYERRDEAKNKIVFFSRELDAGLMNTFQGYGGAVNQRSRGGIEAAKYGATAFLIRSITTKYDNVPHVGQTNYIDTLPKIPGAALGYLDSDFLSEALKKDPDLEITLKQNCYSLPDTLSYNVIGDMKGSESPDEIVIVSGHFDSWDVGCGAHDDGGPCMQAMEVVDLFKRLNIKPKKTIRCILYINEENGVRGGREYAAYADTANEIQYAAIESDRGAFTPLGFTVDADPSVINEMQKFLPVLEAAGINWIKKGGSGVDISFIKNAKALIGYYPDSQRYFDFHHSANDVFEAVHPREMQLGTAAIAILAYLISEVGL
jgi:carboxypeptidase Q